MTDLEQDLLKYLDNLTAIREFSGCSKVGGYWCLEDFVKRHGVLAPIGPRPDDIPRGEPRQCFRNCTVTVIFRKAVLYCEGYALSQVGLPVYHAWLLGTDGRVIDPTWPDGHGLAYCGVPFRREYVISASSDKNTYGLIDSWEKRWPLLSGAHALTGAIYSPEEFKSWQQAQK